MEKFADTAIAIRQRGTDLFLTRNGAVTGMCGDTLFLDECTPEPQIEFWKAEMRRRCEVESEIVRVSRLITIED